MKKGVLAAFLGVFLAFSTEASMISFCVIETGLSQESGRNRHSLLWENALMDVFFDAGYIVSNYPMMRLNTKPADSKSTIKSFGFDVDEAVDAGIDYILIARLDYDTALQPPCEISFFLFKVTQHEIVYEKRIAGKTYKYDREVSDDLRTIIRELLPFINNNL
ncbi:MAG: hypothetical protein LBQ93_01985 [Treponema sp.]|nr:hypothetical protein [Treponema sp.]